MSGETSFWRRAWPGVSEYKLNARREWVLAVASTTTLLIGTFLGAATNPQEK
jgi:hypothetical protein